MVYIDDFYAHINRIGFSDMIVCNMIADSHKELLQMMDKLGLRYIQEENTPYEHVEIPKSRRWYAVKKFKAKEITYQELADKIKERAAKNNYFIDP